jgi:hypothetical protein
MAQTSARAYITGATRIVFFPLLQRRRGRRVDASFLIRESRTCPLAPGAVPDSCAAPKGLRRRARSTGVVCGLT